jgi:hypothetical protein
MFNLEEYLTEDSKKSITRVAFLWLMINAILMGWYVLIWGSSYVTAATAIIIAVTGVATGLKLYQKGQELKNESHNIETEK